MYLFSQKSLPDRWPWSLSRHGVLFVLFAGLLLTTCRKHEELPAPAPAPAGTTPLEHGLPASLDSLHGFLVAENSKNDHQANPYSATRVAMFADPGVALLEDMANLKVSLPKHSGTQGNLNVGTVRFAYSEVTAQQNSSQKYNYWSTSSAPYMPLPRPVWEIEGNKSVREFSVDLQQWPVIADSMAIDTLHLTKEWTIDVDKVCSGYDSVIVELQHQYSPGVVIRTTSPHHPLVTFSKEEVKVIASQYPRLILRACRYSHKKVDGRQYVFELIKRNEKTITARQ